MRFSVLAGGLALLAACQPSTPAPEKTEPAAQLAATREIALVANAEGGTVSLLDVAKREIVGTVGGASVTVLGKYGVPLHDKYAGQLTHHLGRLDTEAVREGADGAAGPDLRINQCGRAGSAKAERFVVSTIRIADGHHVIEAVLGKPGRGFDR